MKKILFALTLIIAQSVSAADLYVRDGGSGNCSDWTNACDQLTTAESSASRGDTIYVADGSYTGGTFNTAVSGTTTITIKKATVAAHGTDTGWDNGYGDDVATFTSGFTFGSNYWVVDGVSRTTATSGHGIKIISAVKGITISGMSNITIRYVDIQGGGDDGDGPGNDLIYGASSSSNITIQYSYLHDTGRTHILSRGGTGWLLEHNYIYKNESIAAEHSEPWSCGLTSEVVVRYNVFDSTEGTAVIASLDNDPGPDNWSIYGNIFINGQTSNGIITTDSESSWTNVNYYNNTVYGMSGSCNVSPSSGTGWVIYNNIFVSNSCVSGVFAGTHDYNYYYNNSFDTPDEAHIQSADSDPFINATAGDFTLASATEAGTTLSSPYDVDPLGTTRGQDGTWDRGAYEFDAGVSDDPHTSTPSSIAGSWK